MATNVSIYITTKKEIFVIFMCAIKALHILANHFYSDKIDRIGIFDMKYVRN